VRIRLHLRRLVSLSRPLGKIERESVMSEIPTFENYVNARVHAWAAGSDSCNYDGTEYRKEWDDCDHRIGDCAGGTPADCVRCRRTFQRVYGDPPVANPADRVARFLAYYSDRPTSSPILTVAGASTDHKDVALMVSDLQYLVDYHAKRRGLVTPTGK
jgi:hypothetical protein